MSFTERMSNYILAEAADLKDAGDQLPVGALAELRRSRLGGRESSREYRLAVSDQCANIRVLLSNDRSKPLTLEKEVQALLELLGEGGEVRDNGR